MSRPVSFRARNPIVALLRVAVARAKPSSLRRLHLTVAVLFALDGFLFGSWAARVPDVSAQVGGGHTALGLALLCLSLGALACMQLTGALCARLGTGLTAALAGAAAAATAVLPGLAGSLPALCAGLLLFGAATGAVNVAANSLGVQVEERAGRPLLSGLHAAFSGGGLLGALLGGLASGVLGVGMHLGVVTVLGLAVATWAGPTLVGADLDPAAPRPRPGPARGPGGGGSAGRCGRPGRGRRRCSSSSVPSPAPPPTARARSAT